MPSGVDLRSSERVPIKRRVEITGQGRTIIYAIAINLSLGGIFLNATPVLAIGSPCRVAISQGNDKLPVITEGTVIRSNEQGTAIQFTRPIGDSTFAILARGADRGASFIQSFRDYFKVSADPQHAESESLLGVSGRTFKRVFLTTFSTSIPVAILPVWLARASLPALPVALKILLSLAYGGLWMLVIQPSMDMTVFRFLRKRALGQSKG